MKVLLVTSPHLNHAVYHQGYDRQRGSRPLSLAQTFAPMGLLSISAAAERFADITIADVNKAINSGLVPMSRHFYSATAEWLLGSQPDLIGFMTECDSYHHVLRIFESLKQQRRQVMTLLGGVHASVTSCETIRKFPAVDFVIRREGELAFESLLQSLNCGGALANVGNLTYRCGNDTVSNPELPLIEDLDMLPFPDFSRIELKKDDAVWVEVGRGCPFKCNFCATAPYWKRKHRIKSAERVLREMRYLGDRYGRTDFNLTHDLFTTDRSWVLNFCRAVVDSRLLFTWTCSSRTDTLDEEQIYWLQRAGCREIYFGVETGTAEMQAKIDKNLDLRHAADIIAKTRSQGIGTTIGFISGLPGESAASLRGTLGEAYRFLRLPDSVVHLFGFGAYHGSSAYHAIRSNLIFDPHFVDFPLPPAVHQQNCRMMLNHFDVFTRYARFDHYDGLSLQIIRAAEEYLPLLNAVRSVVLFLEEREVDPLAVLESWAEWIYSNNLRGRKPRARLYHGSIADFLTFLEHFTRERGLLDPVMKELIRWEGLKDRFRSTPTATPPYAWDHRSTKRKLFTNGSIITSDFDHIEQFLSGSPSSQKVTVAFYYRRDGKPGIVRLKPFARTVLEAARGGVYEETLYRSLSNRTKDQITECRHPSQKPLRDLVSQLEQLDLLICPYSATHSPADDELAAEIEGNTMTITDSINSSV